MADISLYEKHYQVFSYCFYILCETWLDFFVNTEKHFLLNWTPRLTEWWDETYFEWNLKALFIHTGFINKSADETPAQVELGYSYVMNELLPLNVCINKKQKWYKITYIRYTSIKHSLYTFTLFRKDIWLGNISKNTWLLIFIIQYELLYPKIWDAACSPTLSAFKCCDEDTWTSTD